MAQVLQRVCNRCGTDFGSGPNWGKNNAGVEYHVCPDGMTGEVVDVDLVNEKRPNLADMASEESKIKAAEGVLAGWEKRGFVVEMSEIDAAPPRFRCTIGVGGSKRGSAHDRMLKEAPFMLLDLPPTSEDAELLLDLEEPIRCVLAVRGELCRAAQKKTKSKPATGTGSTGGQNCSETPSSEGRTNEPTSKSSDEGATALAGRSGTETGTGSSGAEGGGKKAGPAPAKVIDLNAKPTFAALGYAGVAEAVSGSGAVPPITKCPSCQEVMVFRFWQQPLLLNDNNEAIEIQVIYHCSVCNRDDLYGSPITVESVVPGRRGANAHHPNHQVYPHVATCWPDAQYQPSKFRSPNSQIILAPKVNEDEELYLDLDEDIDEYQLPKEGIE